MRSVHSNRQAGIVTTIGFVQAFCPCLLFGVGIIFNLVFCYSVWDSQTRRGCYPFWVRVLAIISEELRNSEKRSRTKQEHQVNKAVFYEWISRTCLIPKLPCFGFPAHHRPTDLLLLKSVKLGSIHLSFTWLIVVAVLVGQLRPFLILKWCVLLATTGFILMGLGAWHQTMIEFIRTTMTIVLMVPGYRNLIRRNTGSLWTPNPEYRRVRQRDWDNPCANGRNDWKAVTDSSGEIVLVAHSLAALPSRIGQVSTNGA